LTSTTEYNKQLLKGNFRYEKTVEWLLENIPAPLGGLKYGIVMSFEGEIWDGGREKKNKNVKDKW
jgi:hypothetical protein